MFNLCGVYFSKRRKVYRPTLLFLYGQPSCLNTICIDLVFQLIKQIPFCLHLGRDKIHLDNSASESPSYFS